MSVLVKGMEMPSHCGECGIEWCDKWKKLIIAGMPSAKSRPDDCPLIEIPPHGDLVDKQQMAETNEQHYLVYKGEPNADYAREVVLRMLDQAPTIIEAEVEE